MTYNALAEVRGLLADAEETGRNAAAADLGPEIEAIKKAEYERGKEETMDFYRERLWAMKTVNEQKAVDASVLIPF